MQVFFRTKEESKQQQQDEFLALSGAEGLLKFLELSRRLNSLMPVKNKISFEERNKGNFLLIHKDLMRSKH